MCTHLKQLIMNHDSIKNSFACSLKFGCCCKWSIHHTAYCPLIPWLSDGKMILTVVLTYWSFTFSHFFDEY